MPDHFARLFTRWPLRYTVPLVLGFVVVAGGIIGYLAQSTLERRLVVEDEGKRLRLLVEREASQLGVLRTLGADPTAVQKQFAAFARDPTLREVRLVRADGSVIASLVPGETGRRMPPPAPVGGVAQITLRGDELAAAVMLPEPADAVEQWWLSIRRDIGPSLARGHARVLAQLLDYLVYFLVVAAVLWGFFEWAIARRTRLLGAAIERLARGQDIGALPVEGRDELATLAVGLAAAARRLAHARDLNARLSHALEELALPDPALDVFDAIARTVSVALRCRWVGISRLLGDGATLELIGVGGEEAFVHGMAYEIRHTPCAHCLDLSDAVVIVGDNLRARYPDDSTLQRLGAESYRGTAVQSADGGLLGVLFALHDRPVDDDPGERALLRTAAERAAQELGRDAAQRQLREQEQRLAIAMESAGLAEAMWDLESDHLELNPRWPRLLGYGQDEVPARGSAWASLTHPDDWAGSRAGLLGLFRGETPTATIRYRIRARDGHWHWVQLSGRVLARDTRGRATRAVGMLMDIDARERARALLEERTEFLELAVRGSMDGLWDWDIESDRLYLSPRFHELLGYSEDELPRLRDDFVARFHHPADRLDRARALSYLAKGHEHVNFDIRLLARNGAWRWFHTRGRVTRDEHGVARRIVGSISDITERKAREEELARTRRQLQDAVEHIDAGLMMTDADDRLVLANRRYGEMYGYSAELLQPGTPVLDLIRDLRVRHPEYLGSDTFEESVARRLAQHHARDPHWELQLGERWYRIGDFATADGGTVSLRTDITGFKRIEQALRESEARLRTVVDNSPVGIFLARPDGQLLYANNAYFRAMGASTVDVSDQGWQSRVHPEDRAGLIAQWRAYADASAGSFEAAYRCIGDVDGAERLVQARAVPVIEHGQVIGHAGTLEDVTAREAAVRERERLQRQVQQAQKMQAIGQLTGGIAHDFNNILASILGYTTLAQLWAREQHSAKLDQYHGAIRQAAERARELVEKMLAYARPPVRNDTGSSTPVMVVAEAVRFLKPIIPAGIVLTTHCAEDTGDARFDSVDLHQTLVNLALNARDAIDEHGRIGFTTRASRRVAGRCASCTADFDGEFIEITVQDSGAGIAPELLDRVFEPFFSTKDIGKGSGMGLAMTHGLVHAAGGHLALETAPGQGTTVHLYLRPAATPSSPRQFPRRCRNAPSAMPPATYWWWTTSRRSRAC